MADEDILAPCSKPRTGFKIASIYTLVLAIIAWGVVIYGMLVIRPRMITLFNDFTTNLPAATQFILSIPNVAVALVAAGLVFFLVAKEFLVPQKGLALSINCAALAVALLSVLGFIVGVYLPLIALIQKVSEGKP